MVKKLSDIKESKIFQLVFQGYSQVEISSKLGVAQSSVSVYVSQFKSLAGQQGIMAAAKEYGVMDEVQALYDLAVDLKKNKTTVEEAKNGLKMSLLFQECGIDEDEHADLIQVYKKMDKDGYLFAAVELSQLEDKYGNSYEGIVDDYKSAANKLEQAQKEFQEVHGEIDSSKKVLESINKQKQLATQDFKAYTAKISVDMQKLKTVEPLALALQKAGVPDHALPGFIKRQQLFDKGGITIDLLAMIVEKAGIITTKDHGKQLFSLLSEYGNLSDTNKTLQLQIESLTKQAAGLEQQANLKGKIQADIAKLKTEKASLEPQVKGLYARKEELKQVQTKLDSINKEVVSLTKTKGILEQQISQLKTQDGNLRQEIGSLEKKVSDLKEVDAKRDSLRKDIDELEIKRKNDQRRWDIYQAFLRMVLRGSVSDIEIFVESLPSTIERLKKGEYRLETVRSQILQELVGPELLVYKCMMCKETFRISKPMVGRGYYCPTCGRDYDVRVDEDATNILKGMLAEAYRTIRVENVSIERKDNPNKQSGEHSQ